MTKTKPWRPGLLLRALAAIVLVLAVHPGPVAGQDAEAGVFAWDRLPAIPDAVGVAAPFAGISNSALVVAGGANFPEGYPWEGGTKIWHSAAFVLPDGAAEWIGGFDLPRPLAYGVSLTIDEGVLCIGGDDAERAFADVFLLRWTGRSLEIEEMPPLPEPLAYFAGEAIGRSVYIAGGITDPAAVEATRTFLRLDLDDLESGWQALEPWPGPARMLPVAGRIGNAFLLMSGASLAEGPDGRPARTYLSDAYRYDPGSGWRRIADLPRPAVAAPSPALRLGPTNLAIIGGDDGSLVGFQPMSEHPGFEPSVLVYHQILDRWARQGHAPYAPVTVPVVPHRGGFVIPSGEVRPGVRTSEVLRAEFAARGAGFGWINFTAIGIYMALLLGVGFYFSKANKDTNDFFRGGQRIPWWAAGLSIFATTLSSITFMAIPAKAYSENWVFLLANLPILLIAPFIVAFIIPVFRGIDATSAYEYLERRFSLGVRLFGSVSFVLFQVGRMAIVLFLPALALAAVTDLSVFWCILLMGVFSIVYCAMGGILAVIWTDVMQAFVLLGGALLSLVLVVLRTEGGAGAILEIGSADDKFRMVEMSWDFTIAAIWVVILGNIFSNLIPYTSDQAVVQRYMTTRTAAQAKKSVWTNALIAMPATLLFFMVGSALYGYYHQNPDQLVPGYQNDAVFPLFIARELPVGIAGIVVAGIFAAAQSTVSTSMNSTSTVLVTDFFDRLSGKQRSARSRLLLARVLTVVLGALGTVGALLLASTDIDSLWDVFIRVLGLTGGALAGLFLLGIFTRRANATGAAIGAAVGVVVLYLVQSRTDVHFFLYAGVGITTCFVVGYLASLLKARPTDESLAGLTWHTLKRRAPEDGAA